jgi:autotransporter-associated beta strand protein
MAAVTKNGGGSLTLAGNNTYTGDTLIERGCLELSPTGQIDVQSLIVNEEEGAFRVNGGEHVVGDITGAGMTEVISAAELTADSIVQGILRIGQGAKVIIKQLPGST